MKNWVFLSKNGPWKFDKLKKVNIIYIYNLLFGCVFNSLTIIKMTSLEVMKELEAVDFSEEVNLEKNEIMENVVNKISYSLERVFKRGTKTQERVDKILDTLVNSEKMKGTKEKIETIIEELRKGSVNVVEDWEETSIDKEKLKNLVLKLTTEDSEDLKILTDAIERERTRKM